MRNVIIAIFAFIVGLIPGFFIVFNSVFSDSSGSLNERLFTFLLVIVAYVILGFIFGFIEKRKSWLLWVSLSAPAVIILVLYSFKETTLIGLNFLYACLTIGSSWFGSFVRERIRK
jgi:chromate transport protein ChrA